MTARKTGFDNSWYVREQARAIRERMALFDGKLYLEFGGKLLFDHHAARVLPGYDPNVKMALLRELREQADVLLCIYAGDIERKKMRADFGITYDTDAMKMIDGLREGGVDVAAVVITRFNGQPAARIFRNKLERRDIQVFTHAATKGYPTDVDTIVSEEGYGANASIETHRRLVIVTGPGPGSGKLATCLSQIHHDRRKGMASGYAKFETFPIWNLPLKHPVNVAYEAATADIGDFNLIDPFHLEAYGKTAVNYNRDVEAFPVVRRILEKIAGDPSVYKSPTDMGVNTAGGGIVDDAVVQEAARQELIRRWFRYQCEYAMGLTEKETVQRAELLMKELGVKPEDRPVVGAAREAAVEAKEKGKGHKGIHCGAALELADGAILTGKNSALMHAASSLVLNAAKTLAGIPDEIHLLSPSIIEAVANLKRTLGGASSVSLDLSEVLIGLGINASTNPAAHMALDKLKGIHGCEVHMTHMPTPGDEAGFRRLGVNLTTDPNFSGKDLFVI
jgi:uncharacterized protein (UPF0371 family)